MAVSVNMKKVTYMDLRKLILFQKIIRVVYQGVEGAYSQAAMWQYFGHDVDAYNVELWRDAMEDVKNGKADYGVFSY